MSETRATKGIRTCVGCGTEGVKADFVRIVRSKDGSVALDSTGRLPGRGAYLCRNMDCFAVARRARGIERSLRTRVDEGTWTRLEQEFDMLCAGHSDVQ